MLNIVAVNLMNVNNKLFDKLRERLLNSISLVHKAGIFAAGISLLICILMYAQDCCPYPISDKLDAFCWIQSFIYKEPLPDDVLLINTSNDKEIVEYNGSYIPISDRSKIVEFLKVADSCKSYKAILFDLYFETEITTSSDSALGALLADLPRIIIIRATDIKGSISSLQFEDRYDTKVAYNSFYTTILQSDFSRYPYYQNGEASAALRLYSMMGGARDTIKRKGPLFFSHKRLCTVAPITALSRVLYSFNPDGTPSFTNCNIGRDYLERVSLDSLSNEMKDKIIIIGDFENDVYDAYGRKVPGSLVAYGAYKLLYDGRHIITIPRFLLQYIFYFVLCLLLVSDTSKKIHERLEKKRFALFILSFISYSAFLTIWSLIVYIPNKIIICTFVPSVVFSIITKLQGCGYKMYRK